MWCGRQWYNDRNCTKKERVLSWKLRPRKRTNDHPVWSCLPAVRLSLAVALPDVAILSVGVVGAQDRWHGEHATRWYGKTWLKPETKNIAAGASVIKACLDRVVSWWWWSSKGREGRRSGFFGIVTIWAPITGPGDQFKRRQFGSSVLLKIMVAVSRLSWEERQRTVSKSCRPVRCAQTPVLTSPTRRTPQWRPLSAENNGEARRALRALP